MSADPTRRAARAQRYLEVIDLMVEVGAEHLQQLRPKPQPDTATDPAATISSVQAFDRATRAIRLCMLLAEKFEQVLAEPDQIRARRTAARGQVARGVEDSIARANRSPAEKDALAAELRDRLDRPETIADLESRPFREIVLEICRDLGLHNTPNAPAWPRRTPQELDRLRNPPASPAPPTDDPLDDDTIFAVDPKRPGSLMEWALQRARDG